MIKQLLKSEKIANATIQLNQNNTGHASCVFQYLFILRNTIACNLMTYDITVMVIICE